MKNLDNSMTVQLAGAPMGDPLTDAMHVAIMAGTRRVAEMNEIGFDTNNMFDLDHLAQCLAGPRPFLITSLATSTVYLVICQKRIGDTFHVAVQVYNEGKVNEHFYKMRLVRAANGSICATPGW